MVQPTLFTPLSIRELSIRNRIWVAPMCQYSADDLDGLPTDWHLVHLGAFAQGGAGLILTEATAVSPEGRISPQDLGIWNDEQASAFSRINRFLHAQGATSGIQLAHAGRKASTFRPWGGRSGSVPENEGGWQTIAPSAVPYRGYASPLELTMPEIDGVVDDFVAAARRSLEAGFDVVELHAAHGYLVHQFLSPFSNQRTDAYGGSLENRARLLLRLVSAVRAELGEHFPLLVRLSATDWTDGGWDEMQTAEVSTWAKDAGADVFDISSGGNVAGVSIPLSPGYQVPFAEFVGARVEAPVAAVGLITTAAQAAEIVSSGRADAVLLGREFLRDPHFPLRAAHELGIELDYWPDQYDRARW